MSVCLCVCVCVCKEAFSSFPGLQGLEMPVNALRGLSVDAGRFLQLQVRYVTAIDCCLCLHMKLPGELHQLSL